MTMEISARLSLVRQQFSELLSICDPGSVSDSRPSTNQRSRYIELLKSINNHIDAIETELTKEVFEGGAVQRDLPRDSLTFYKENITPRITDLDRAFKTLDQSAFDFYQLLDDVFTLRGDHGKVRDTFDVAIVRMEELVEDNPDQKDAFSISRAFQA